MENLRVDNPCPFLLSRMNKQGDNYFCKSCSKEIIDFRNKSQEEIRSTVTDNTCGIFHAEQLPEQQRTSLFRQGLFYALTFCSFLGFNVRPVAAAPLQANVKRQLEITRAAADDGKKDKDKKKKKKKSRKKKVVYRTIGCPSF